MESSELDLTKTNNSVRAWLSNKGSEKEKYDSTRSANHYGHKNRTKARRSTLNYVGDMTNHHKSLPEHINDSRGLSTNYNNSNTKLNVMKIL